MASKTSKPGLPLLMSVEEAAVFLGISEERVYRMVRFSDPPFPHVTVGRRIVVPTAALLKWVGRDDGDEAA